MTISKPKSNSITLSDLRCDLKPIKTRCASAENANFFRNDRTDRKKTTLSLPSLSFPTSNEPVSNEDSLNMENPPFPSFPKNPSRLESNRQSDWTDDFIESEPGSPTNPSSPPLSNFMGDDDEPLSLSDMELSFDERRESRSPKSRINFKSGKSFVSDSYEDQCRKARISSIIYDDSEELCELVSPTFRYVGGIPVDRFLTHHLSATETHCGSSVSETGRMSNRATNDFASDKHLGSAKIKSSISLPQHKHSSRSVSIRSPSLLSVPRLISDHYYSKRSKSPRRDRSIKLQSTQPQSGHLGHRHQSNPYGTSNHDYTNVTLESPRNDAPSCPENSNLSNARPTRLKTLSAGEGGLSSSSRRLKQSLRQEKIRHSLAEVKH